MKVYEASFITILSQKGFRTFDHAQLSTGPSCSNSAFPWLLPCPSISYMRTFLSQEATARCSETGENETSDMLSSGGSFSGTSFDISPCVGLLGVLEAGVEPKSDILRDGGVTG